MSYPNLQPPWLQYGTIEVYGHQMDTQSVMEFNRLETKRVDILPLLSQDLLVPSTPVSHTTCYCRKCIRPNGKRKRTGERKRRNEESLQSWEMLVTEEDILSFYFIEKKKTWSLSVKTFWVNLFTHSFTQNFLSQNVFTIDINTKR